MILERIHSPKIRWTRAASFKTSIGNRISTAVSTRATVVLRSRVMSLEDAFRAAATGRAP
jgi:hypothetical protein